RDFHVTGVQTCALPIYLTNPEDSSATTIDTTRLTLAVIDTQAEFEVLSGVVYDNSDPRHVYTAMQGVLYYLQLYRGISFEELNQIGRASCRERGERSVG